MVQQALRQERMAESLFEGRGRTACFSVSVAIK